MQEPWYHLHRQEAQASSSVGFYEFPQVAGKKRPYRLTILIIKDVYWLVVWNMFYFRIYWDSNHPNWRTHIFQRGSPTTNQWLFDRNSMECSCRIAVSRVQGLVVSLPDLARTVLCWPWQSTVPPEHKAQCQPGVNKRAPLLIVSSRSFHVFPFWKL